MSSLPMLGGYLDLKQCEVCTVDDIDDCHRAYLRKMQKDRDEGVRAEKDWGPWEHRLTREGAALIKLEDALREGKITWKQYRTNTLKLKEDGRLYDNDYDSEFEVERGE